MWPIKARRNARLLLAAATAQTRHVLARLNGTSWQSACARWPRWRRRTDCRPRSTCTPARGSRVVPTWTSCCDARPRRWSNCAGMWATRCVAESIQLWSSTTTRSASPTSTSRTSTAGSSMVCGAMAWASMMPSAGASSPSSATAAWMYQAYFKPCARLTTTAGSWSSRIRAGWRRQIAPGLAASICAAWASEGRRGGYHNVQMPAPQNVVQAVQAAIVASAHLAAYEHVAAAAQAFQRLGALTSGRWRSAGRDLARLEEELQTAFATAAAAVESRADELGVPEDALWAVGDAASTLDLLREAALEETE